MIVAIYSAAIQEAMARGDLVEMKELLAQAETHVKEWGNVPVSMEMLKAEILKEEALIGGIRTNSQKHED